MYSNLGIITPDVTRTLGFISREAQRSLGIITPDVTRTLGIQLLPPSEIMGVPLSTWAAVLGMAGTSAGIAGYIATRSAKGMILSGLGGLLGSAAGVATASYLNRRAIEKRSAAGLIT